MVGTGILRSQLPWPIRPAAGSIPVDRSQSILKSLVAAVVLTSGLLGAGAALAQRAITNSNSGNDGAAPRSVTALVSGDAFNTYANNGLFSGGYADVFSVTGSVESDAAARILAAGYVGKPNST